MRQERPRRNRPLTNYRSVANLGSRCRPSSHMTGVTCERRSGSQVLYRKYEENGRQGNGGVRFSAQRKPGECVGIS